MLQLDHYCDASHEPNLVVVVVVVVHKSGERWCSRDWNNRFWLQRSVEIVPPAEGNFLHSINGKDKFPML
jgi:hypothetical protein